MDLLNEYEIKKPILFNTDSSKSKLWVDYNPKIRKIDGKELSLLNRVYSALKPVENRLDDSLRLSPSLDRVMMKYGYWEWIEDREKVKKGRYSNSYRYGEVASWRKDIFERDDHTCQHCFQKGGQRLCKAKRVAPHDADSPRLPLLP